MSVLDALRPGDPARVGVYRLLGRLGAGGMGQVFLGVSPGGRKVAVKLLHPEYTADPQFRLRFAREVAAARTVSGFYTAPVVDADPSATPPWMVTAYVPGPSLTAKVTSDGPLPADEVRQLGAALAEGLAAIHSCGLIHRDLKPSNIIVAEDGARIIDFGIARAAGSSTLTGRGTVLGTYAYMSPEQVLAKPTGPESDVFSLGAVLAFAATGRGPFDAETIPAITHKILSAPPDLAGLDGPLRDLIEDCLGKDPANRPVLPRVLSLLASMPDAEEGAAPAGSGLARPAPEAVAPPAAAVPPATALASPGTPVQLPVPAEAVPAAALPVPAQVASPASASAPAVLAPADYPLPGAVPGPVTPAPSHVPPYPAPPASVPASPLPGRPGPGLGSLVLRGLPNDGNPVVRIAFSANGRLLAGSACYGGAWRVYLWDTLTRQLAGPPLDGHGGAAPRVAFSPDGRLLAIVGRETTYLRSMANGQPVGLAADWTTAWQWKKVLFSPNGYLMATLSDATRMTGFAVTQVRFWNTATLAPLGRPVKVDFLGSGSSVGFSPDARFLLAGTETDVLLCDMTAPAPAFQRLRGYRGAAGKCSFSADGQLLAVESTEAPDAFLVDTASRRPLEGLRYGPWLTRLEFAPAGRVLAAAFAQPGTGGSAGGCPATAGIDLLSPGGPSPTGRTRLGGFSSATDGLSFSAGGQFLAASADLQGKPGSQQVCIWHTGTGQAGAPLDLPGPVTMRFSPDTRFFAASCADQSVRLWDVTGSRPPATFGDSAAIPGQRRRDIAFSPDGRLLAATSPAGVFLWVLP